MSLDFYRLPIHNGIRGATLRQLAMKGDITMDGNIDLQGNKLLTTSLSLFQKDSNTWYCRNRGGTADRRFWADVLFINSINAQGYDANLTINNLYTDLSTEPLKRTITAETLGAGVTTFAVTGEAMEITGDAGGNTIATITGGQAGQILMLFFVDGNVTITDTDAHTADTIDLVGVATDFTSADDSILILIYDGTSWYEISRSVN